MTVRDIVMAASGVGGAPAPTTDPQFNYVTLLLNDTGTNGQQNNTFLDSSTNNFTITRNGTPTQGSVTPYWPDGQWSNYFSGTVGNYISVPDNAAFQLGSGDFTIEGWVNLSSLTASSYLMGKGDRATVAGSAFSLPFTNYTMDFYAGSSVFSLSTFTPTLNVWFHIAIVRNGTTITRYINGVSNASVTIGTASINTGGSNEVRIGGYVNSTGFLGINGYLSNLRIVKGTALYTSAFTPSTTPLTAVSGTSLLTCQSNRFKDNSSNNFAITVTGTPTVQSFDPFSPAASYGVSNGGSGYFSGSGQYLSVTDNAAFDFGSGDFTIESWVCPTSYNSESATVVSKDYGNAAPYQPTWRAFLFQLGASGGVYNTLKIIIFNSTTPQTFQTTGITFAIGTWYHVAAVRSGNTMSLYVNGTLYGSGTITIGAINDTAYPVYVGVHGYSIPIGSGALGYFPGYISNLRIVKGTAVYTANFTPPTSPVTAITGTSLLLNFTNAGIYDAAVQNDLVTVGNAQVSTAVAKFGSSSMYFDGSGDCLTTPDVGLFDFGTGAFTVEAWVNLSSFPASGPSIASGLGPNDGDWMFLFRSNTQLSWGRNHVAFDLNSSGVTFSTNTWYHIAVTKSAGTLRVFVDGVQRGSASNSQSYNVQNSLAVGARQGTRFVFGPGDYFPGYIDDLRITKGFARYTANFTPPTAPFPTR